MTQTRGAASCDLDLNAYFCKQKVLEALLTMHSDHHDLMNMGAMRSPIIRIDIHGIQAVEVDDMGVGIN